MSERNESASSSDEQVVANREPERDNDAKSSEVDGSSTEHDATDDSQSQRVEKSLFDLFDVVRNGDAIDWDAVISRVGTHPEEAKQAVDEYQTYDFGCCLDSVLLLNPPLEAVEAVARAFPQGIYTWTPLGDAIQIACCNGCSLEVIRFLTRFEKALTQKTGGSVFVPPFKGCTSRFWWISYYDVPFEVLKVVVEEYAKEIAQHGDPLCDFFKPLERNGYSSKYDVFNLLLMCADHQTIDNKVLARTGIIFQPLHALLRHFLKFIEDYKVDDFLFILVYMQLRNPSLFEASDFTGKLPLEVIIEKKTTIAKKNTENFEQMFRFLIIHNPKCALTANARGRMPLHVAIDNGWPTEPILKAAPRSLTSIDVETGLYPFQLAAVAGTTRSMELANCDSMASEDKVEDVNLYHLGLTYSLLKMDPTLVLDPNRETH